MDTRIDNNGERGPVEMSDLTIAKRKPGRPRSEAALTPAKILLLEETIRAVANHGPLAVSARKVCTAAGVMFAAVNYNFGSWNGLLAAATAKVYREYSEGMWQAALTAERTPEARLRAYIWAQVEWARAMPGWGAAINYPISVQEISAIRLELYSEETVGQFRLNQARQWSLVRDIRNQRVTDFELAIEDVSIEEMLKDELITQKMISLGWSVMGMTVWASRGSIGEVQVGENIELENEYMKFHIDQLIELIKL